MNKFKAIIVKSFGAPSVMQLTELSKPKLNETGEVLLKISGIGVNPVETYIRAGNYAKLPNLPYTPGTDCVGVVEKTTSEKNKINDVCLIASPAADVYPGAYSQYVKTADQNCINLGESAKFGNTKISDLAACGVPFFTAYRALVTKANLDALFQKPVNVLIHGGSGAVGLMAIQVAKIINPNCRIVATAGSEIGEKACLEAGADEVVPHSLTSNFHNKFKIIIEMLADQNLADCMKCSAQNGRIVIVGSRGDINVTPRDIMASEASIVGCSLFNQSHEEYQVAAEFLISGLDDGKIHPKIDTEFKLSEAAKAHEYIMHPDKKSNGKVVLLADF